MFNSLLRMHSGETKRKMILKVYSDSGILRNKTMNNKLRLTLKNNIKIKSLVENLEH